MKPKPARHPVTIRPMSPSEVRTWVTSRVNAPIEAASTEAITASQALTPRRGAAPWRLARNSNGGAKTLKASA